MRHHAELDGVEADSVVGELVLVEHEGVEEEDGVGEEQEGGGEGVQGVGVRMDWVLWGW